MVEIVNRPSDNYVMLKTSFALLAAGILAGCHTMTESHSPSSYNQTSYQTKNADGETVTRTVRTADRSTNGPIYQPIDRSPVIITPIASTPVEATESSEPRSAPNRSAARSAKSSSEQSSGINGSLDLAWTSGHFHIGGHAGLSFNEWFMIRIGLSAFASKDLYLGADLSTRFHLPLRFVRPYVGAGAYFGDSKKCSTGYDSSVGTTVEVCDKKFLTAGYGEAGIEFGHVSVFVRDYRLSRAGLSIPTDIFWGLGLRF